MAKPEERAGEIYDLGYRHYDGARLGRAGAVKALFGEGVRTIFGIGRGFRAKIPPIFLIILMIIPALVQAALSGLVGGTIQIYRPETYFATSVWIFALFCAFQTPQLVTGDVQHRVLALYFSRAVLRSDYVLARIGALASSMFIVALLPHAILLIGRWFAAEDVVAAIKESLPLIPKIVIASFLISILLATVSLTIASLIRRAAIGTGAILGYFLLSTAFTAPLIESQPDKMGRLILISPTMVGWGLSTAIFDTVKTGSATDSLRQSDRRPLPPGTPPPRNAADSMARRERRIRRQAMNPIQMADVPGAIYLATMAGYLLICGGILTLRYRRIDT